nr:immunoglobulin heavy chain junction region [Macaca mulatta]
CARWHSADFDFW